ncbi:MAG: hypothetical protein Fur0039_14400 [Rhodocyclaceae bacterium]
MAAHGLRACDREASELFRAAVADATPLRHTRAHLEAPRPAPKPRQRRRDEAAVLVEAIEEPATIELSLEGGDEAAFRRPGVPRTTLRDLRRGRWVVQDALDLHGSTRAEAHALVSRFLAYSLRRGLRCVRVVHGKGLSSPGGEPVLKGCVQSWLARRAEVMAFCQARAAHGGGGALVVLLRAAAGARTR